MSMGKQPEAAKFAPDLTKHFVFGDNQVLHDAGNERGSFLHKNQGQGTV